MACLVGIDEAGFGPLLGPLVVSSSAFSIPDNLLSKNLWQLLKKSTAVKRSHLAGRLLIADSKKAYTPSLGIGHLTRTVLACLHCQNKEPQKLSDLLSILCPEYLDHIASYPWYSNAADYPLSYNKTDVKIAAHVFANDLSANNMKLLSLKSCCLDVEQYNDMVAAVKNKSICLFSITSRLIQSAWDCCDDKLLHVIIDRQGGRSHYRRNLQLMFDSFDLAILKETNTTSSYELSKNNRKMIIHFVVAADSKFLPASLASMVSKFLRELMVDNINRYFTSFNPALKPTAGYWTDGLRFIKDLKTLIPHVPYDSNQLIRSR